MTWDYLDLAPTVGRNISGCDSTSPCLTAGRRTGRRKRMSVRTVAMNSKIIRHAAKHGGGSRFTVRGPVGTTTKATGNTGTVLPAVTKCMYPPAGTVQHPAAMKLKTISAIKNVKPNGNNRTGSAATTHYGTEGWTGIGLSEARWRHGAGVQNEKTTWPTPARCAETPTVPYTYITSSPFYQAGQMMNTTTSPFALLATGRWNHSPNGWMSSAPYCPSSREGWRQGG